MPFERPHLRFAWPSPLHPPANANATRYRYVCGIPTSSRCAPAPRHRLPRLPRVSPQSTSPRKPAPNPKLESSPEPKSLSLSIALLPTTTTSPRISTGPQRAAACSRIRPTPTPPRAPRPPHVSRHPKRCTQPRRSVISSSSLLPALRSSRALPGHPPHTYSPLEQMQFVESLNNAFSVAALKPDVSTYENTYPSSFDLPPAYPNGTMYYSESAPFTVRPCSPTFTSACVPYSGGYMQAPQYVHQPLEVQSNVQYLLPGPTYSVQPVPMNGHPSIIAPRPSPATWPRSPAIAQRLEHAANNADHSHQFLLVGNPEKAQDADAGELDGPKKNRKKPPALSCYFCRHRKIRCCEISQPGEEKRCK